MSSLSPSRRSFVKGMVGTASFWMLDTRWQDALAAEADAPYTPRYFTATEWAFLQAACERIFPKDETGPGAQQLGIPKFIDMQMDTPYGRGELWYMSGPFQEGPANLGYQLPYAPREIYRRGIAGANAYAQAHRSSDFASLDETAQIELLTAFEGGAIHFDTLPARGFFEQLRQNTLEGAFSDPVHGGNQRLGGWIMLGFPGARADFMDWVNQEGAAYPFGPVSISGETA